MLTKWTFYLHTYNYSHTCIRTYWYQYDNQSGVRLIHRCGLYTGAAYTPIFKTFSLIFEGCGLYTGAAYTPEITVHIFNIFSTLSGYQRWKWVTLNNFELRTNLFPSKENIWSVRGLNSGDPFIETYHVIICGNLNYLMQCIANFSWL